MFFSFHSAIIYLSVVMEPAMTAILIIFLRGRYLNMKKLLSIIIIALLLFPAVYGCSNPNVSSTGETQAASAEQPQTEPIITEIDGLSFQTKQKAYQADIHEVITVFTNNTKDSYSYGAQYQLQEYQNNRWVHKPLAVDTVWDSHGVAAAPGGSGNIKFPVSDENSALSPGRYRIVLPITNGTTKEDRNIAAEFTINE